MPSHEGINMNLLQLYGYAEQKKLLSRLGKLITERLVQLKYINAIIS